MNEADYEITFATITRKTRKTKDAGVLCQGRESLWPPSFRRMRPRSKPSYNRVLVSLLLIQSRVCYRPIRCEHGYASASTLASTGCNFQLGVQSLLCRGTPLDVPPYCLKKSHPNLQISAPTLSDCPRNEHVNFDSVPYPYYLWSLAWPSGLNPQSHLQSLGLLPLVFSSFLGSTLIPGIPQIAPSIITATLTGCQ